MNLDTGNQLECTVAMETYATEQGAKQNRLGVTSDSKQPTHHEIQPRNTATKYSHEIQPRNTTIKHNHQTQWICKTQ